MNKVNIESKDIYLAKQLKLKQKTCNNEFALIKLIDEFNNEIILCSGHKYAIIHSVDEVPSYYEIIPVVLSGKYKITWDCSKDFESESETIESNHIQIYRAGVAYIFVC